EISHPSRNPDRKPNFKPKHGAEPQRYEDRKPHEGTAKPKFEGTGYKGKKPFPGGDKPKFEGTGYKGKKPFAGGKPKFEGAAKPHVADGTPAFKEKKAAWKKKKR
ncbi:MAG: hypothetical protein ABL936_12550, partial [Aestuariivirga sp.]